MAGGAGASSLVALHTGRYSMCLGFPPAKSQATNTPITLRHAGGTAQLTVDQRKEATLFNFVTLGEFTFKAGDSGFLEVSNSSADGRVAIDGARWVWLGEQRYELCILALRLVRARCCVGASARRFPRSRPIHFHPPQWQLRG